MQILILVIIFWIPPLAIILKDMLWNLSFWENKEYRFGRFFSHIYWDKEEENRNPMITYLKFIFFCTISTLFISPILSIIGMLAIYSIWTWEIFGLIEKLIKGKLRQANVLRFRNLATIILLSAFLGVIIVLISVPFIYLPRDNNIDTFLYLSNLLNLNSQTNYPDVYIFLGTVSIVSIMIDLASPLILSIFVFLTSPIGYLANLIKVNQLKAKLNSKKHLLTIGIIGSFGKSTTKNIIYNLLKDEYPVLTTEDTYSSINNLASEILKKLHKSHQVLLFEAEAYHKGELQNIFKVLKPKVVIFTDLSLNHLEGFKGIKELKTEYKETIGTLSSDSFLIYNSDNKYIDEISNFFKGEKIPYGSEVSVEAIEKVEGGFKLNTRLKDELHSMIAGIHKKETLYSLLPALILSKELGMSKDRIEKAVNDLKVNEIERIKGDMDSILLVNNSEASYKTILSNVKYAKDLQKQEKSEQIFFVTNGIKGLGKYKLRVYKKLAAKLSNNIDYLITNDPMLARTPLKNNFKTKVILAKTEAEIIFRIRENLKPKDIVLIEGKLSNSITESLRSQDF